jgi:hypothetical protein
MQKRARIMQNKKEIEFLHFFKNKIRKTLHFSEKIGFICQNDMKKLLFGY